MWGKKILIVFVFGLLGLNESSAQIFVTELFPAHKDSLYDYQIYQRYYWWAYYPGLCGYTWGFRQLDGQLIGQLAALGYLPQLNYCNCPTEYSYYPDGFYNSLYWHNKKIKYIYGERNSGKGRNYILKEKNIFILTNKYSIDRVVSQSYIVKNFKEETQSDIDQSAGIKDKSGKTVLNIEKISTQRIVLVKQPAHGKEIFIDNIQGKDQLKTNLKENRSWNTESISEKIKKDPKLNSGIRKVYVVDKPIHTNGWENFRRINTRSSQNNGNQDSGKSYNNNSQRSYSSGSGNNTQRNSLSQNNSSRSNGSISKTKVVQ